MWLSWGVAELSRKQGTCPVVTLLAVRSFSSLLLCLTGEVKCSKADSMSAAHGVAAFERLRCMCTEWLDDLGVRDSQRSRACVRESPLSTGPGEISVYGFSAQGHYHSS